MSMSALTKPHMTVDEYLAWAAGRPGRYELCRGEVFAMSPEVTGHLETKGAIYVALKDSIRKYGLACRALPDGATVRIDDDTAYEPDALVYCGKKLPRTAIEIPNPVIIVEVMSPSTRRIDETEKLADYFLLPSVAHYLIVNDAKRFVIHHARGGGGTILTRIVTEGMIALDPPGLELAVADIFGDPAE
jgi:Uma2 family endonuclease